MKICVAQTKLIKGDIQANIETHIKFVATAVAHNADIIIFPELSLTGYEPTLAQTCAIKQNDQRLDPFQTISNSQQITIGVGIPTQNNTGINISLLLFQPHTQRLTYSKKYLHADEEPFFVSGQNFPSLKVNQSNIAFALCYEITVPTHAQQAKASGAEMYIASVAKSATGVEHASKRLAEIAATYSMPVLMSNCVGPSEGFESAGNSAVWNHKGLLLGQLDATNEGVIIYDCNTQSIIEKTIEHKL